MDSNIKQLIKKCEFTPKLEYSENTLELRDNVQNTLNLVKRRLGILEELLSEINFKITLSHLEDE